MSFEIDLTGTKQSRPRKGSALQGRLSCLCQFVSRRFIMLRRLTPNAERLWSMAEVAGGRMPKAPRAIREPLGNVNGPQSIRWPKSRFQIILLGSP